MDILLLSQEHYQNFDIFVKQLSSSYYQISKQRPQSLGYGYSKSQYECGKPRDFT